MALNNPRDLFLFELCTTYDAENKIGQMRAQAIEQAHDQNLVEELRKEQAMGERKIRNLEGCFQALGVSREDIPCLAIDGMLAEFRQFIQQNPSPDVLDMYIVGAANKAASLMSATYQCLMDKATLMGQTQCAQLLQTNMVQVDEAKGCLERIGHEISERTLAPA